MQAHFTLYNLTFLGFSVYLRYFKSEESVVKNELFTNKNGYLFTLKY